MTFATRCLVCGGPILVWDDRTAKCIGLCELPPTPLEDMTAANRARAFEIIERVIAIETAANVAVKDDVL